MKNQLPFAHYMAKTAHEFLTTIFRKLTEGSTPIGDELGSLQNIYENWG